MNFGEVVGFIHDNWPVIVGVSIIVTPIIWLILHFLYGTLIENLRLDVQRLRDRAVTDNVNEIKDRRDRAASLQEGKWYVYWQYNRSGDWVGDECYLRQTTVFTEIEVLSSPMNFDWKIFGRGRGRYLFGDWTSRNPGSTAFGTVLVTIEPQGRFMCGYWIGPAKTSDIISGRVVCALERGRAESLSTDDDEFCQFV